MTIIDIFGLFNIKDVGRNFNANYITGKSSL
jgi:hypothetical protein